MVTTQICNERHSDLNRRIDEVNATVKEIRDNHLPHIDDKIDKIMIITILLGIIAGGQLIFKLIGL